MSKEYARHRAPRARPFAGRSIRGPLWDPRSPLGSVARTWPRTGLLALGILGILLPHPIEARRAVTASLRPEELVEYETESPEVKRLIEIALDLTRQGLGYRFGSNSPKRGGMDCSGTVQAALLAHGFTELPRSSQDFYHWAKAEPGFVPTPSVTSTEDPIFAKLRPGDLLFWQGTYDTGSTESPISHVMIFLGTLKADGKGVVFGASSGRRYRGQRIDGVSVFDWEVPKEDSTSDFVGYGPIPGLRPPPPPKPRPSVEANVLKSLLDKIFKKSEILAP